MHPISVDAAADGLLHEVAARLRAAGCVYAEEEARLLCDHLDAAELGPCVDRRVAGAPLELVLGWAWFCGLRVAVEEGVFVPRRRTEFLARLAAGLARPGATVLDLCCGTGAVGMAVAAAVPGLLLHAADVDPVAVRCARRNLAPWQAQVHEGDLYAPLPPGLHGRIDLLTVNAPYVPADAIATLPREARLHEPRVSLDGGIDGCEVQRRVAAQAAIWLVPGGHLLMETGELQATQTAAILRHAGLSTRTVRDDERDASVVIATKPR